ncbi:protein DETOXIFICATION 27-like isoform X3 [Panicum hallii]|uniref:protein DETOXIFICATION 27-like isoform X3 n=1 Tax=Panicum hallii TaxID=206008 RepID=UPI000DF4DB3B|nr:protein DETOXIFICATION 27-like isoform X3 [Panicum hallii]
MESQSDVPLISELPEQRGGGRIPGLAKDVWVESKKLWVVAGPAAFTRLTFYGMTVVSQAFAGHIGDLELAAFSIAATVISGLSFGFFVGMASAMETLCGQAYGARQYHMMGIYLQRSWLVLLGVAVLLTPTYIFSGPLLAALGQPAELSRQAGSVALYLLPLHFVYAIILPLNKFLQCQRKNWVAAVTTAAVFPVHVAATWLLVRHFRLGVFGAATALAVSWGLATAGLLSYAFGGGCPETWRGFSASAFVDLKDFVKLSAASGVMLCLENWYYRILVFLTGYVKNAELAVDALSIWSRCWFRVASASCLCKHWELLLDWCSFWFSARMGLPPWGPRNLGWNDRWHNGADSDSSMYRSTM